MSHLIARRYGRSGIHITWVLALLIAGFGVFRYLTSSQVNPITGQSQRVAMSPQQEIALGLQAAPQMASQMGGEVSAADPRAQLVKAIGQKLVRQIETREMPWKFEFHLLNDPNTVNAFALPGGQVFITTALFNRLQNEAQLAGVLGHEIGHVIERHAAQHMAKGQLGQMLTNAVAVGASDQNNGQMAAYAAAMANQMLQLKYGRDDELQSDSYGVKYMTRAGFDPAQMIEVMRILEQAGGGGRQPEFMSTHPNPGNRAERIGEQIRQQYPNGLPPNLRPGRALKEALGAPGLPDESGASPGRTKW